MKTQSVVDFYEANYRKQSYGLAAAMNTMGGGGGGENSKRMSTYANTHSNEAGIVLVIMCAECGLYLL